MYARQKIKYSDAVRLRDPGTLCFDRFLVLFSLMFYRVSLGLCCPRNGFGPTGEETII